VISVLVTRSASLAERKQEGGSPILLSIKNVLKQNQRISCACTAVYSTEPEPHACYASPA
jgi:hypothetical protein